MPTTYDYYNAVLYAIQKISQGYTPTKAVDEARLSWDIFKRYCTDDLTLSHLLDEATQRGYDAMVDALLTLNDKNNPYHCTDPKEQKVVSDNIKWIVSRRDGKRYGDRVEITVEATVQHVITSQLEEARQRAISSQYDRGEVIDAEYVMLPPPPPPPPTR